MEFFVLAYDGDDAGALERRMRVREAHLAKLDDLVARGHVRHAAAILDEAGTMVGSTLVVDFPSRAELDAWLAEEPYVVGDVWRDVTVAPCRAAPQFARGGEPRVGNPLEEEG
jgi:uncharacterized protein YciI